MAETCYVCRNGNIGIELCRVSDTDEFSMKSCDNCGHASRIDHLDFHANLQIQRVFFDQAASRPKHRPRRLSRYSILKSRIEALVNGGRILDIGCGNGLWLSTFGNNWQKHGVELSEKAASIAREFASANVHHGPIEEYATKQEYFDVITAFAVIEHMQEPRFLVEWSSVHLRRNGVLLLMTGDRQSTIATRMASEWPLYKPREHVHFFSSKSIQLLLEEAGFAVIKKEWRPMRYPCVSAATINIARIKDVLGLLSDPIFDHLYVYSRKSNSE